MMDIGIFSWFGFSIPMKERAGLIRETGYQSVMLWWSDEYKDIDGPKESQPEIFRSEDLHIVNMHTPFYDANELWTDTLRGQAMEEVLSACIADCDTFGIPVAVIHLTEGQNPPEPNTVGLERLMRLTERAERFGIDIALENLRYPRHLEFVYSHIQSKHMKFCYDSGHENCRTPHIDFLQKYGDRLAALHLHDNDGTDDQHILPFDGTVPWDRVAAHLRSLRYSADLTLEIDMHYGNHAAYTAREYLAEGMNRAKRLREMIEGKL